MDPTAAAIVTVASIMSVLIGVKLLIGQHRIAKNQVELAEFIRDRTEREGREAP